jgi:cytidine deaminase
MWLIFTMIFLFPPPFLPQCLIALAAQHREPALLRIAVSAAPCGHCRQFCRELARADDLVFVFGAGDAPPTPLPALLPRHFGPADLVPPGAPPPPLLLEGSGLALDLTPASAAVAAAAPALAPAVAAALAAARAAHAPHTRSVAGVAVVWRQEEEGGDGEGRRDAAPTPSSASLHTAAGFVIESAAYNPTLPPFQAALVAARGAGMADYGTIVAAVLVERPRARVGHAQGTRLALAAVAPGAELTVLHAVGGRGGDSGYESGDEGQGEGEEGAG